MILAKTAYRKIIRLGNKDTMMVSIPIEYCRKYDLKKGDYVKVITTDVMTVKPITEGE